MYLTLKFVFSLPNKGPKNDAHYFQIILNVERFVEDVTDNFWICWWRHDKTRPTTKSSWKNKNKKKKICYMSNLTKMQGISHRKAATVKHRLLAPSGSLSAIHSNESLWLKPSPSLPLLLSVMQIIMDVVIALYLITGYTEKIVIWVLNDNAKGQLAKCLGQHGSYNLEYHRIHSAFSNKSGEHFKSFQEK